jgi:hypothetical protein
MATRMSQGLINALLERTKQQSPTISVDDAFWEGFKGAFGLFLKMSTFDKQKYEQYEKDIVSDIKDHDIEAFNNGRMGNIDAARMAIRYPKN